jgi:outer membrane protein OmpA-like peptidoglycan-associated protein
VKPGAPPPPAPVVVERVVVNENRIKLNEEIIFKEGSAELDPKSVEYVNYIARVIREHEGLDFIEVGGHANTDGPDSINTPLSQKRAETVVKALIDAGVSPKRLRAVGYGSFCPLDPSKTPEALKVNKRVEFAILRRNGKNLKDKWDGCDGALGHKDAKGKNYSPQPIPATAPKTKEWVVKSAKIKLNGFQLVFSDQVRFQPQTATIVPATEPALAALQAFLAADKSITKVRIEGHTDPPDSPDMVALSKARSIKVAEWLANHGIDRGRLLPVGCGGSRPIQKGGVIDYDKSRRTEAHIIGKNGAPVNGPEIPPGCSAD